MADLNAKQSKIVQRYYDNQDSLSLDNLGKLVSDLWLAESDKEKGTLWTRVAKALVHTAAEPRDVKRVLELRDVERLAELVNHLSGKGSVAAPAAPAAPAAKPRPSPPPQVAVEASQAAVGPADPAELKRAYGAFKRRFKLQQREAGTSSGRSPLSSGGSQLLGMQPPREWPMAVWEELAKQGRLKRAGGGLFALP